MKLLRHRRTRQSAKVALRVSLSLASIYAFLIGQALITKKRVGTTSEVPPDSGTVYGIDFPGEAIRLLVLGDSTAVGYGMKKAEDTPTALIADSLSYVLDTPVNARSAAVVGAQSKDLIDQINAAADHRPQIAVILVGANDIRHQVRPSTSAERLATAIRALRAEDCEVIVGTCPDLGTIKLILPPLRTVVRHWSRRLAKAQTVAAVEAGARVVSVGDLLGPLYLKLGEGFFGDDRYHPSKAGYAHVSSFLVAAAVASWRARDHEEAHADLHESIMSVNAAAIEASEHAGTEVVRKGRLARVLPGRSAN